MSIPPARPVALATLALASLALAAIGSPIRAQEGEARVQLLASRDSATALAARSAVEAEYGERYAAHIVLDDGWYKLQVGDFETAGQAARAVPALRAAGYRDAWVVPATADDSKRPFWIQLLATRDPSGLGETARAITRRLGGAASARVLSVDGWHKLQVGAFPSARAAEPVLSGLRRSGYPDAWLARSETAPEAEDAETPPASTTPLPAPAATSLPQSASPVAPATIPSSLPAVRTAAQGPVPAFRETPRNALGARALRLPELRRTESGAFASTHASPPRLPAAGRFAIQASVSGRVETNIDHDQESFSTWGIVAGAGVRYRVDGEDTELEIGYEVARHEYRDAPRWNRIGHTARIDLERELGGPWTLDLSGEASIGGSTEDRELANVFSVRPRLELELGDGTDLRLGTAFRLKRYAGEPDRDATAPYASLELRRRWGGDAWWTIGTRYGIKHTPTARRRYRRWTHEVGLGLPTALGHIELGLKLRTKRYTSRTVDAEEEGDAEPLRHDRRIGPSLAWVIPLGHLLGLRIDYDFEARLSNDPDKEYDAHAIGVTLWSLIP